MLHGGGGCQQLWRELAYEAEDRRLRIVAGAEAGVEGLLKSMGVESIVAPDQNNLGAGRLVVPVTGLFEVVALAHHLEHVAAAGHLLDLDDALAAICGLGQVLQC
jgi:hypothetical protein